VAIIDALGLGHAMVLVIHDEVLLEVPTADAKDALRAVEEAMTDRTTYRVPLTAEGKIMTERWQK
jgi:DNA polymerase I-like protein with 3'-5' exonuclease and polymerase domains